MSKYKTVIPKMKVGQEFEEARLAAETLPGRLVQITGAPYDYVATANTVRGQSCWIVYENELFGKNCQTPIPNGERAMTMKLEAGMLVTAHIRSGIGVAVNDLVVPHTDGTVDRAADAVAPVQATTGNFAVTTFPAPAEAVSAPQLLQVLEACASGATGDDRRVLCRVLR